MLLGQVMSLVLTGLFRQVEGGLANVCLPHGATSGYDPHPIPPVIPARSSEGVIKELLNPYSFKGLESGDKVNSCARTSVRAHV